MIFLSKQCVSTLVNLAVRVGHQIPQLINNILKARQYLWLQKKVQEKREYARHIPKRKGTIQKYLAIQEKFKELLLSSTLAILSAI